MITEWSGRPVGGAKSDETSCNSGGLFSEVGAYNYSNYYKNWSSVDISDEAFEDLGDGTFSVKIEDLASYSCTDMRIAVVSKATPTDTLARVEYHVPIIVKDGTKTTNDAIFTGKGSETCETCDVVILSNATLKKVSEGVNSIRDIEVYAGGNLWIPSGQTFTANQLIMRSKGDVVPTADIQGTLSRAKTTLLHDKRIDGNRWYFFALPYDCDLAEITFRNGEAAAHGTDYLIKYYDGEERAASATAVFSNSTHWKPFEGATIKAGQGYIVAVNPHTGHTYAELRFPMKDPDLKKGSTNVTVHAWGGNQTDEALRPNHKGWNLVGNPFLNTYKSNVLGAPLRSGTLELDAEGKYVLNTTGAKNVRFVYVPVNGGYGNYTTAAVSSQALSPFYSYFVQIGTDASKTGGDDPSTERGVEFTSANVQKASIVRRAPQEEIEEDDAVMVAFDITNDKQERDETTLLISDQFTDGYDIMDDGLKWRGSQYTTYTTPIIATRNNEGEMAFNAMPDSTAAKTGVPVNFYAAYAGEYIISLNGMYGIDNIKEAKLFDATTNQYYDLLTDNYTFTATKGNNTERFRLFVTVKRKSPAITTGNDNLLDGRVSLTTIDRTLVLSGLNEAADIYVYDMNGKLIRSDKSAGNGNVWRTDVPATGVYFVRVNGTSGQQTLRAIVK